MNRTLRYLENNIDVANATVKRSHDLADICVRFEKILWKLIDKYPAHEEKLKAIIEIARETRDSVTLTNNRLRLLIGEEERLKLVETQQYGAQDELLTRAVQKEMQLEKIFVVIIRENMAKIRGALEDFTEERPVIERFIRVLGAYEKIFKKALRHIKS